MQLTDLGALAQIAYVTDDLEAALAHWTDVMGAGPFVLFENFRFEKSICRGRESDIVIDAAIGYWGDLQIELIAQCNDADSAYAGWQGRGDVHHLALEVADLAAARDEAGRLGFEVVQHSFGPGGIEIVYLGHRALGHFIELLPLTPSRQAFYRGLREAHRRREQPLVRRVAVPGA